MVKGGAGCRYTTIKRGRRRLLVPNAAFLTREFTVMDEEGPVLDPGRQPAQQAERHRTQVAPLPMSRCTCVPGQCALALLRRCSQQHSAWKYCWLRLEGCQGPQPFKTRSAVNVRSSLLADAPRLSFRRCFWWQAPPAASEWVRHSVTEGQPFHADLEQQQQQQQQQHCVKPVAGCACIGLWHRALFFFFHSTAGCCVYGVRRGHVRGDTMI